METTRAALHVYSASVPWPEQAKLQIAELQATEAAQTAEINRLIDRLDHLERIVQKYINGAEPGTANHPQYGGVTLLSGNTSLGSGAGYIGETLLGSAKYPNGGEQ